MAENIFLSAILCYVAVKDIKTMEISNRITCFIFILAEIILVLKANGIATTLWNQDVLRMVPSEIYTSHVLGMIFGGAIFLLIALATGGIGGGDIKLMFALGLWLGIKQIFYVTTGALMLSGVWAGIMLLLRLREKTDSIPLVPFIAIAVCFILFL